MKTIEQIKEKIEENIKNNYPFVAFLNELSNSPKHENTKLYKKVQKLRKKTHEMIVYNDKGDIITL